MDYKINFSSEIVWKEIYYRNFKNKNSKHVLCFPDHNLNGHEVYIIVL